MRTTPALMSVLVLALAGCGLSVPADPDGTLHRVTDGELRVGLSPNPPWTVLPDGDDETPGGREVELVRRLSDELGADVSWTIGGEEDLMGRLDQDELDLVVGGLTEDSPWTTHAALTLPYTTAPGPDGEPVGHVLAAPLGENAFLVEVERVLLEHGDAP